MVTQYKIVYPDELNHVGVKGMKWGVRKERRAEKKNLNAAVKNLNKNTKAYNKAYREHTKKNTSDSLVKVQKTYDAYTKSAKRANEISKSGKNYVLRYNFASDKYYVSKVTKSTAAKDGKALYKRYKKGAAYNYKGM